MSKTEIKIYVSIAVLAFFFCMNYLEKSLTDALSIGISTATSTYFLYDKVLWKYNPFDDIPKFKRYYTNHRESNYKGTYSNKTSIEVQQSR